MQEVGALALLNVAENGKSSKMDKFKAALNLPHMAAAVCVATQ
jgi:hypothetical protein